jgi:hypothetical protein
MEPVVDRFPSQLYPPLRIFFPNIPKLPTTHIPHTIVPLLFEKIRKNEINHPSNFPLILTRLERN